MSDAKERQAFRAISRIIRQEERRQRRCWRHEDCREDHGLGAVCYALRRRWPWAQSAVCQGECCVGPSRAAIVEAELLAAIDEVWRAGGQPSYVVGQIINMGDGSEWMVLHPDGRGVRLYL